MAERKGWKKLLLYALLTPAFCLGAYLFTSGHKQWAGVDEAVVEKIAKEHGREAKPPLIDPGSGDLLLFAFLVAGVLGGFAGGYYWRELFDKKG